MSRRHDLKFFSFRQVNRIYFSLQNRICAARIPLKHTFLIRLRGRLRYCFVVARLQQIKSFPTIQLTYFNKKKRNNLSKFCNFKILSI